MLSAAPRSCHPVSGCIAGNSGPAGISCKAAARASAVMALPQSSHQQASAFSNCSALLVPLGAQVASSALIQAKVFRSPAAFCSASQACQPFRRRAAAAMRCCSSARLVCPMRARRTHGSRRFSVTSGGTCGHCTSDRSFRTSCLRITAWAAPVSMATRPRDSSCPILRVRSPSALSADLPALAGGISCSLRV